MCVYRLRGIEWREQRWRIAGNSSITPINSIHDTLFGLAAIIQIFFLVSGRFSENDFAFEKIIFHSRKWLIRSSHFGQVWQMWTGYVTREITRETFFFFGTSTCHLLLLLSYSTSLLFGQFDRTDFLPFALVLRQKVSFMRLWWFNIFRPFKPINLAAHIHSPPH